MDALVLFIPVEILKDHLSRAQDFGRAQRQGGVDRHRRFGNGHPRGALRVQKENPVILVTRPVLAQPRSQLCLRLTVARVVEDALHQGGEDGIPE